MLCFSTRYVSIYCGLVLFCAGLLATATDNAYGQAPAETTLPQVDPQTLGFDAEHLQQIDALVSEGIAAGKMPGCVLCFGRHGKIAWLKAYGNKRLEPETEAMTTDTVFDMASITKPTATATSIMKLLEMGKLRLNQTVVDIFPEFAPNGKDDITIRDLLIHQSGLVPDNALSDYEEGPEVAWQKICDLKLVAPVGQEFKYSDVNFIVLAKIVERVSGMNVNEFSHENIFAPLHMTETGYLPAEALKQRAAPTQQRDGKWMQGDVHDPRAHLLDGIAGHAGLFSTANDLAVYATTMLDGGSFTIDGQTTKVLSPRTVELMTAPNRVSSGIRGLGWDKKTGYSSNKGDLLSDRAFGHGGFTGTVLWMDPSRDLFFIFLSNRVHPDGKGSVNGLAGQILNVVASSLTGDDASATSKDSKATAAVETGIDVLVRDNFRQLAGQRIGLITNHTGRAQDGRSTAVLLQAAEQVDVTTLFSPEHGFEGKLDIEKIGDTQDSATGLKVFSLYGPTRKPTPEMLANLDTIVFDIQDIGCRFYTYVSTMGEAMRAAAEQGKRFVVLDRPNPINGLDMAGPMLDAGLESFVGFHHLPLRHGMTAGELAQMFKDELKLELDLQVIRCENWQREDYWEATGLTWINPSPNMRSLTEATLYPGVGVLETTNISVGRGTDIPFEWIGAPWIDARQLAAELTGYGLPGVIFVPVEFTPTSSKYEGELCHGVNIAMIDRAQFEPLHVGFALEVALRKLLPDLWQTKSLNRLLGNKQVEQAILDGKTLSEVVELSQTGLRDFAKRRKPFLLY
ncbi:MAG: DUF1343 domain-containing protein [Pirellulaceae bacterium]